MGEAYMALKELVDKYNALAMSERTAVENINGRIEVLLSKKMGLEELTKDELADAEKAKKIEAVDIQIKTLSEEGQRHIGEYRKAVGRLELYLELFQEEQKDKKPATEAAATPAATGVS